MTETANQLWLRLYGLLPEEARVHIASQSHIVRAMDYQHAPILLSIRSQTEYRTRTHSCKKEPETVAWIEQEFRAGDVFYDVGANVGAYSLVAAKCHAGAVKVFAFEPSFANYAQLCSNLLLNNCADAVSPIPFALSDTTQLQRFNYRELGTGTAYNALGEAIDHRGDQFTPGFHHDVPCITMMDFVEMFQAAPPDHIKIDVDGVQMSVLRGARELLAQPRLRSLLVEARVPDGERELVDYLAPLGYVLRSRHQRHQSEFYNFIFGRG